MPDLFARLPPNILSRLSEPKGFKNWRICANCHVSHVSKPLRACSGCVQLMNDPFYYCSKKCQKEHWSIHKRVCSRAKTQSGIEPQTTPEENILKITLGRWCHIHYVVLIWCLQNIYHYNTHLDPHTTCVTFYLRAETMQIWYIGVEKRETLQDDPSVRSDPHLYLYTLHVCPPMNRCSTQSGMGMVYHNAFDALDTPATRAHIIGHPQWLFIAISLTEQPQPSRAVADKKISLLRFVIKGHLTTGRLVLGPEFDIPRFEVEGKVELEEKVVASWFAKLTSIHLWKPLLETRPPGISSKSILHYILDEADKGKLVQAGSEYSTLALSLAQLLSA